MNYFLDFAISILLTELKSVVKNPGKAAELKSVMLKIYTQIGVVFGTDPQFQEAAKQVAK